MKIEDVDRRRLIGNRIKRLRESWGMTQMELAAELGYTSTGMISQVENGQRGIDLDKLYAVCKLFHMSIDAMLDEDERAMGLSADDLYYLSKFAELLRIPPQQRPHHFKSILTLLDNIE